MIRTVIRTTLLACLLGALPPAFAQSVAAAGSANQELTTVAERSGFQRTGRYEEVIALCGAFARAYPDAVRCERFGTSAQGRPMQRLVVTRSGAFTPAEAEARGLPVLLAQGGIHAGEIDGKDAGFLLLRQLLEGEAAPGALEQLVLVFVPVFNVDGHENFRAWNRPNQRGPEEMGFRTTAQRYNLNRDYMKADSPEMRAMLALVRDWDPLVTLDLHVTDGAQFRHDISITGEPVNTGDMALRKAGRALRDGIAAMLTEQGSLPVVFYPSFDEMDDPASGFVDGVNPPRFSHGYFPLRNRLGILVETHSWRTYPERVRATRDTVLDAIELTVRHAAEWQALARAADARARALGGEEVALDYRATDDVRTIDFLGYAYTRTPSEVSGALMTRYDESTPQVWQVPLRDVIVPRTVVTAPTGGYLVPVEWASVVQPWLDVHGIAYQRVDAAREVPAWQFHANKVEMAASPMEGHQRAAIEGDWRQVAAPVLPGSLFVPIAQPLSRLVVHVLEPRAPDSIARWGGFNNAFERKEYMEPYVAEAEARRMLAADPALKAEFEAKLRDDPEFAASPYARLDFFYQRHPAWDSGYNVYPVLRLDAPLH
ncbi:M14 family metallopeptidase [Cognatiluteimonas lumbrici]|uniref:M14 family metallopeptidase n=1 Tax=Cognatiluteimonas lumbrici TaxID=2559601 RepID=UPI00112C7C45|nr:M14 family metallopeptidase [Luteimonas lumbrici]